MRALPGIPRARMRDTFLADAELPTPSAAPCPVCGGPNVVVDDYAAGTLVDRLRFSHSESCWIGRAEDSTRDADYRDPNEWLTRWSTLAEVDLLTGLGFTRTGPPALVGTPPVLVEFDPVTGAVANGTRYPQMTYLWFPTAGAGIRCRVFPDLIEGEQTNGGRPE